MSDNGDNAVDPGVWETLTPHLTATVGNLLARAIGYLSAYDELKFIFQRITTTACCDPAEAAEALEKCAKWFPSVLPHKKHLAEVMIAPKTACEGSLCAVKDCIRPCENMFLGASAALSFVGLAFQTSSLRSLWKEVCAIEEFIKNGAKSRFAAIQKKIDQLSDKVDAFATGLDEKNILGMDSNQRLIFQLQKDRQKIVLDADIQEIKDEIDALKWDIVIKLADSKALSKNTWPNLAANVSQCASLVINLTAFATAASPIALFAVAAAMVGNVVAAGGMLVINNKCTGNITELEKKLKAIEDSRGSLRDIENRLRNELLKHIGLVENLTNLQTKK